jgi:hypothetical protein
MKKIIIYTLIFYVVILPDLTGQGKKMNMDSNSKSKKNLNKIKKAVKQDTIKPLAYDTSTANPFIRAIKSMDIDYEEYFNSRPLGKYYFSLIHNQVLILPLTEIELKPEHLKFIDSKIMKPFNDI